jgi:hypothetical protein
MVELLLRVRPPRGGRFFLGGDGRLWLLLLVLLVILVVVLVNKRRH